MNISELVSRDQLRGIHAEDYSGLIPQEDLLRLFEVTDSYWVYPGEPRPEAKHALLRSGRHSNGFVNCLEVLQRSNLCCLMGQQSIRRLPEELQQDDGPIDWVVGAAYSGIDYAHDIAISIGANHGFAEKDEQGNPTKWRFTVEAREGVLIANELMTTQEGSTWMAKVAVDKGNKVQPVRFIPFTLVMFNRSGIYTLPDGSQIISVIDVPMEDFDSADCPYCVAGSEAIKPKQDNNWALLKGSAA